MKKAASKTRSARAAASRRASRQTSAPAAGGAGQENLLTMQNQDLRAALDDLEESRRRCADLYDTAPVGYLTLDAAGRIREINQTAVELLGTSVTHLTGRPLLPYISADDRKVFLKHLWESRRGTKQVLTRLRLQTRNGVVRHVQIATNCSHDFGGQKLWLRTAILDVTPQYNAEAALSASEARFRLLAESVGDVLWFMELNPLRVTYVSPAFERIWGIAAADLYACHGLWEQAIDADDLAAVHTAFQLWIQGETAEFNVEYRVRDRHGNVRWLADRGIVIGRENGLPRQICGIARDITERKRAEMDFSGLLEAAPDAMVVADHDGIIQLVNAAALRLFGYERDEMVGRAVEMLVPERFRARHPDYRKDYSGNPHARPMGPGRELFALRKDGSEFPTEITLNPLHTDAGVRVISAIRDISERKRAETALRESEERFRLMADAAPVLIWIAGPDKTCTWLNQRWLDFTGRTLEQELGNGWAEGVHEEDMDRCVRTYVSAFDARQPFEMDYRLRRHDGEWRWVLDSGTPLFAQDGVFLGYIGSCVDITERKAAAEVVQQHNFELEARVQRRTVELRTANEELRRQMAERQELQHAVLKISEREQQRIGQDLHDNLGQQLAGIWCMSQLLEITLAEKKLSETKDAAKISGLIGQSLTLTRALARGLHPAGLETGGLCVALDELALRTSDMFGVKCRSRCSDKLDIDITTATHLFRIVQEAVTNAIKHGGAREIDIEISSNPHQTLLSVQDHGRGLPTPPGARHDGMGLLIMKHRAEMIDGVFDIQNDPDGGTIITCTIPASGRNSSPQPSYAQKSGKTATKKNLHRR